MSIFQMVPWNLILVVWCFTVAQAGPIRDGFPKNDTLDDGHRKLLRQLVLMKSRKEIETFQDLEDFLQRKDWSWVKITTTKPPFTYFNKVDYPDLTWPKHDFDGSIHGKSNNMGYSSSSTGFDIFSLAIPIFFVVKFVLICRARFFCPCIRREREANGVHNPQPTSIVIREDTLEDTPTNGILNLETDDDDFHDTQLHQEQKTLVTDEDLPPSYEEVILSSTSNSNPDPELPSYNNVVVSSYS